MATRKEKDLKIWKRILDITLKMQNKNILEGGRNFLNILIRRQNELMEHMLLVKTVTSGTVEEQTVVFRE